MSHTSSAGRRLRDALAIENPLQIVGTINAYSALMAENVGFRSIYLSGWGVANASYGLPDIGMTTLNDVLEDVRRITNTTELPLLVDARHRLGECVYDRQNHPPDDPGGCRRRAYRGSGTGKTLWSPSEQGNCDRTAEMADRMKAAADAKTDPDFVVMARTDAAAIEGVDGAIERACRYVEAGADMIFAEALTELDQYRKFANAVDVPILANITEFGKTPLYTIEELKAARVSLVLYPLSAFRAMSAAALNVYQTLRREGTQKDVVHTMQTRAELYEFLNYHEYERKLDQLLNADREKD